MDDNECPAAPLDGDEIVMEDVESESEGQDVDAADSKSVASDDSGRMQMEPFQEYLPKIERLLRYIGLDCYSAEVIQRGFDCQNNVYALNPPTGGKQQHILRVPVLPDDFEEGDEVCASILNDASLLAFLANNLPVPRIRLPGESLARVYEELDQAEKRAIVDLFVGIPAKVEAITLLSAGTFTASSDLPREMGDFFTTTAPSMSYFNEGEEEFVKTEKSMQDRAGVHVKALLVSHLEGWVAKEELAVLEAMDQEGAFKDGPDPIVLNHWDLEPRNIMVEKIDGAWKICGIIDWDDAVALPRPLARKPPSWIWDFSPEEFTGYMDCDHQANSNPDPNHKLPDEDLALKSYFESKAEAALPGYLEDAYGRGRWLRRIWRFFRWEMTNQWYMELMKLMWEDWNRSKVIEPQLEELVQSQPV